MPGPRPIEVHPIAAAYQPDLERVHPGYASLDE
jgi:hypothetical protein